jgi:hypothetical protein
MAFNTLKMPVKKLFRVLIMKVLDNFLIIVMQFKLYASTF